VDKSFVYIYGQCITLLRLLLWLVCLEQGSSQGCIEHLHTVVSAIVWYIE